MLITYMVIFYEFSCSIRHKKSFLISLGSFVKYNVSRTYCFLNLPVSTSFKKLITPGK